MDETFYSDIVNCGGSGSTWDTSLGIDGGGNIDIDPMFVNHGYWDPNNTPTDPIDDFWVDGDYHLLGDSPCIDTGDPTYPYNPNETDLDGNPRVYNGRVDIGAYEDKSDFTACGVITKNTTWDANTINVTCDVTVNNGVTLTINPGTDVIFLGQYKIDVQGNIVAEGNMFCPNIISAIHDYHMFLSHIFRMTKFKPFKNHVHRAIEFDNWTIIFEYCLIRLNRPENGLGREPSFRIIVSEI